jgi:hypothetical protein
VAVAPGGDVLVTDREGVARFAADGTLVTAWAADLPVGVAAAPDGTVYISEHDRVARFSASGAPAGAFAADRPRGIAVAADGTVWVALAGGLAHVTTGGAPLGTTAVEHAHGVAAAPDGAVLVSERGLGRVTRVTSAGVAAGAVGGAFKDPRGIAVDCRGNVAVADDSPQRITRIPLGPGPPPCPVAPVGLVPPTPERPVARRLTATPAPAPALLPALGRTALAATVSGRVQVRLPGVRGLLPVQPGSLLPMGARLDARDGRVRLAFATRTADFDALGTTQAGTFDSGVFSIHQRRAASLAELRLEGATPDCRLSAFGRSVGPRHLWSDVHGRFRTRGALATVTARSARWLTEDRCDGTLVRVTRGTVRVRDLLRGRVVRVPAGGRYVVRPARWA